ncbi:Na/Pi cotransporter family protein [Spirochaeta cellobiosiphila]|uniref:Na/Pi cotransporter family protein n=1 Tax=Spirochaeta cellobiosiphila TaxID=504483 RepID=UPI00041254C4|nr:Na/Pi cotransporter family protein [Spirochaeta cellobiosiphila]
MFAYLIYAIGGLGIFLYGMKMLSDSLYKTTGSRIRNYIQTFAGHPIKGILTGLLITSIIQSSSATTVMLISLVNAGLLNLTQSIAVIMGANIGTTFTAWIVSLLGFQINITSVALPAIALSLPFYFSKRDKLNEISRIFLGFGLLFLGLGEMKDAVQNLTSNIMAIDFIHSITGYGFFSRILFVLIGGAFTILLQSSSAAMTVTLTFAYNRWINFDMAAALIIGENIGTTVTAYLASVEMNREAKRAARAHFLFNTFGALWMVIFLTPFLKLIDQIVPGSPENRLNINFHLAAFHTLFNVTNVFITVWFIPIIAQITDYMIIKKESEPSNYRVPFIRNNLPDRADINLINARKEVGRMSQMVSDLTMLFLDMIDADKEKGEVLFKKIRKLENYTDEMEQELSLFLSECTMDNLSEPQRKEITSLSRIIVELESVADASLKAASYLMKKRRKSLNFHQESLKQITEYSFQILDFLRYNTDLLNQQLQENSLDIANMMEKAINENRSRLTKISRKEIKAGGDLKGELTFMEIIRQLEHIGDYCLNIAQANHKKEE